MGFLFTYLPLLVEFFGLDFTSDVESVTATPTLASVWFGLGATVAMGCGSDLRFLC